MTKFQKSVLDLVKNIPWGRLATYQQIAQALGQPKACRAVGSALKSNPFAYLKVTDPKSAIPCHRVVCSNGHLGGFQSGAKLKRQLLEKEGIIIKKNKIQNFKKFLVPNP